MNFYSNIFVKKRSFHYQPKLDAIFIMREINPSKLPYILIIWLFDPLQMSNLPSLKLTVTNIATENRPLEKEIPSLETSIF